LTIRCDQATAPLKVNPSTMAVQSRGSVKVSLSNASPPNRGRGHHPDRRSPWDLLLTEGGRSGTTCQAHQHLALTKEVIMQPPKTSSAGQTEVRIVATSPESARRVAEVLRRCFAATEQRSYPAGRDGGTRLDLTVDTTRTAEPARSWLETSRPSTNDAEE
jgi:hypothetical protein